MFRAKLNFSEQICSSSEKSFPFWSSRQFNLYCPDRYILVIFWVFFILLLLRTPSSLYMLDKYSTTELYSQALSCFVLFPCLFFKNGSPSVMQLDFAWTLRNLLVGFLLIFCELVRNGSLSLFWMFFPTRVKISSVTPWDNFWNHVLTFLY